jgi:hypothetical protein
MSNEALATITRRHDRDIEYTRMIARDYLDQSMHWRVRALRAEAFAIVMAVAVLVGVVLALAG